MRMRLHEEDEIQKKGRLQKEERESGLVVKLIDSDSVEEDSEIIQVKSENKIIKENKKKVISKNNRRK